MAFVVAFPREIDSRTTVHFGVSVVQVALDGDEAKAAPPGVIQLEVGRLDEIEGFASP
jgi:hypothetical protein